MHLQKDVIVRRAIEVLDQDGLEGVTLRRLAKALNAQAGSIYYHVAGKEALLDEMANAILQEHFGHFDFADDTRDWATWLETLAGTLRAAMLAHRDGARVVAGVHLDIALILLKVYELSVRVLHNAGFSLGAAAAITVATTNFTFGFVIEEQSFPGLSHESSMPRQARQGSLVSPILINAMIAWMNESSDAQFDACVRILINGARAALAQAGA